MIRILLQYVLLPLSFAQQRLWFLNQFEDNSSATYNMPVALQLSCELDIEALQQSLHWLQERHDYWFRGDEWKAMVAE